MKLLHHDEFNIKIYRYSSGLLFSIIGLVEQVKKDDYMSGSMSRLMSIRYLYLRTVANCY